MQVDQDGNVVINGAPFDIYDYVDECEDVEGFAKSLAEIRQVIDGVLDYIEDEAPYRKAVDGIFLHR